MPELFIPHGEYFYLFSQTADPSRLFPVEQRLGLDPIGNGRECVVVAEIANPEKVFAVAVRGLSPADAKLQYYLQKMMNTLFPHNFPAFHASFSGIPARDWPEGPLAGTIRERVYEGDITGITYFFSDVERECKAMGIPIHLLDNYSFNFINGEDGGQYYVDNLGLLAGSLRELSPDNPNWRLPRIMRFMERKNYSEQDMLTVASSYGRAVVLTNQ
ncbi:MAG: hypothetical protein HYV38_02255 [Candidatus Levybacteria bacterium]|nr:hypothetical protein [Candidatus Levybacteria bacterium]